MTNLVPKLPRLLGQQVVAARVSVVMQNFDFFDWLFTVTRLRTVNRRISSVTDPVPKSFSR